MDDKEKGFKAGDECPFCDCELTMEDGVIRCSDDDCFFNEVQFEQ